MSLLIFDSHFTSNSVKQILGDPRKQLFPLRGEPLKQFSQGLEI